MGSGDSSTSSCTVKTTGLTLGGIITSPWDYGSGGGGGYSGGDGGWISGGGGSYNTGASPTATAGVNTGHGYVTIDLI